MNLQTDSKFIFKISAFPFPGNLIKCCENVFLFIIEWITLKNKYWVSVVPSTLWSLKNVRKIIPPGSKMIKKEGNKEWQMPLMTAPDSPYRKNTDPVKERPPTQTQVVEFCRVANSTFEGFFFFLR